MGNVRERRRKKLFNVGGRTSVEVERVRATRVAVLPETRAENLAGKPNAITGITAVTRSG